jgi:alpha-galactosidase
LPDDPAESRTINLASLILGQNGIWGDLPGMSGEGVAHFGKVLSAYKKVRDDITEAYPVTMGPTGGCPEIHEKISARTGRGAVVIFATERGTYSWITQNPVDGSEWHEGDITVERDGAGRARIEARFAKPGAVIVLFGAR